MRASRAYAAFLTASLVAFVAWVVPAGAQTFPSGPIKIIVPYAPGGQADITARLLAEGLKSRLPQPVIVENRPGANGSIGTAAVAQAAPDGHTLVLVVSSHVFGRALMPSLPFDPITSFAPITMTARTPVVLVGAPNLPANTLVELVAYAKARPGELAYASAGNGSNVHVFGQWFNQLAKLQMIHVPYKGSAAAHADLIAGRVQVVFDTLPSVQGHIVQGNLKLFASAGKQRLAQYPSTPTIAESGYPEYEASSWGAVLAPAGTPKPVIDLLNREIVQVLHSPAIKERLASFGSEAVGNTPEELLAILTAEQARYGALIRELGIKMDQ
jgi:tripartite-type tricarboxylate transporter receptor subunit TctC